MYWAQQHSKQLYEGEDYWTVCPTYSICFLNGSVFNDENYHHTFRVVDNDHGALLLCKDLEMHFLELTKFNLTAEQIQTPLHRWCYFLKHGASLDSEYLPAAMDAPNIRRALEILTMLNQDELERELYLSRMKATLDESFYRNVEGAKKYFYAEGEEAGFEKGEAAGFEKGKEAGLEEGAKQARILRVQFAQRVLKQPVTAQEELLRLTLQELSRLADELEKQVLAGQNGSPS